jgi:rod shape determining protein RodA
MLLFSQLDLGSALTFPAMFFAMLYVSNLSRRFFAYIFAGLLIFMSIVVLDIYGYRNFLDEQQLDDKAIIEKYENISLSSLKDC